MKDRRSTVMALLLLAVILFAARMCYELITLRADSLRAPAVEVTHERIMQADSAATAEKDLRDSIRNEKKKAKETKPRRRPVARDYLGEEIK